MANDFLVKVGYLFDEASLKTHTKNATNIFGDVLKDFRSQLALQTGRAIARGAMQGAKDMVQNVMELDKALTEFKKVSDFSGKALDAYAKKASDAGKAVGRSGAEMMDAATQFKKSGYTEAESLKLASVATKFQNIADAEISAADAAMFINSQMKAFNITADEAESIIDKVNETANNFAFGTDDMQKALTLASSSLKTYGNDINEIIAILGANMETMPNKASQIGRAWNTMAGNINKLGKESDTWAIANGKVNVSLKETNGDMRSTYDILSDLYTNWDKLTKGEKENVATVVGGTNHRAKFLATMDAFGDAVGDNAKQMGIYQTALESAGSAERENAKYQESFEFKINNLKAAWKDLSNDFMNSEGLKSLIDFGTKAVNVVDKLVETIGPLPVLFGGVALTSKGLNLLNTVLVGLPEVIDGKGGLVQALTGIGTASKAVNKTSATTAKGMKAIANTVGGGGGLIKQITEARKRYKLLELASGDLRKKELKPFAEDVKNARKELGNISMKQASSELDEAKKSLAGLKSGLVSTLAVTGLFIAGVAAIKLGEYFSFDKSIERMHDYQDQLKAVEDEIETLSKKSESDGLTKAEETRLKVLEAQERSLQRQIELEKKRARQGFEREVTSDAGLAGEAGGGLKEVGEYQAKLAKAQDAWNELQQAIVSGSDEAIQKASDKYDKLATDLAESGATVAEKWETVSTEIGEEGYKKLSERAQKAYDDLHKTFVQSGTDVTEVSDAIGQLWDKLDDSQKIKLGELDLSQFKTAEEFIQYLKDNEIITFDFKYTGADEVEKTGKEISRDRKATIKFHTNADSVLGKIKDLWAWIKKVSGSHPTQSLSDIANSATGKRKGEKGGWSWVGDEMTPGGTPQPEMIVHADGSAELSGTHGWQLVNLKSSDTVYTATQTKKLLGGKQNYQFGASEIPRYANGKYAKSGSKSSEKWASKMETWQYKVDIGKMSEKTYIKKLEKLSKKTNQITKDQYRDMKKTIFDYYEDIEKKAIDNQIKEVEIGKRKYEKLAAQIKANKKLTKESKEDLLKELEKAQLKNLSMQLEEGAMSMAEFNAEVAKLKRLDMDDLIEADEARVKALTEAFKGGVISFQQFNSEVNKLKHLDLASKNEAIVDSIETMIDRIDEAGDALGDFSGAARDAFQAVIVGVEQGALSVTQFTSMLNSIQSSIIRAAEKRRDAEIDAIEKQLDAEQNRQRLMEMQAERNIKAIEKQIAALDESTDAIDKQIEALRTENEEQEKQNELLEAEARLAEAKSKKIRVWQAGVGYVYKENVQEVKEAQKALDELKRNQALEVQTAQLEAQKQAVEAQKAVLQEAIDKWQEYLSTATDEAAYNLLLEKLGMTDEQVMSLTGNSIYLTDTFKDNYEQVLENCNGYEMEIDTLRNTEIEYTNLANQIRELIQLYIQLAQAKLEAGELEVLQGNVETAQAAYDKAVAKYEKVSSSKTATKKQKQAAKEAKQEAKAALNEAKKVYSAADQAFVAKWGIGGSGTTYQGVLDDRTAQIVNGLNTISSYAYASGTTSATPGVHLVGERGPELRLLNRGDKILDAVKTSNLLEFSRYRPRDFLKSMSDSHNVVWNIESGAIIVQGVSGNAEKIANDILTQLQRKSVQAGYRRK